MSEAARLHVWLEGEPEPIGVLERGAGASLRFTYRATEVPALSVRLPPRTEPYGDAEARAFFDNLLPEGEPRAATAARHRLDTEDVLGLLRILGAEAPGAVSVLPAGAPPVKSPGRMPEDYEAFPAGALEDAVRAAAAGRAPGDGLRFSLAGVQAKIAVAMDDGGRFLRPRAGAPTTHILKVGRVGGRERGIVANEFLCLRVFRSLGLPTVEAEKWEVGGVPCLVVTRYDRARDADGAIRRLHQEDAAQILGLDRSLKYERDAAAAGREAGLPALFGPVANACRPPLDARETLLQATFLNWLVGNSDAHAKNFAVLHGRTGPRLAPIYDVVCIAAYPDFNQDLAMRIGRDGGWDGVGPEHWDALAALVVGTRSAAARRRALERLRDLALRALPALLALVGDGEVTWQEAKLLHDVIGTRLRYLNGTLGWGIPADTDAAVMRGGGWAMS